MQPEKNWFYLDNKHQQMGGFSNDELFELYSKKVVQDNNYVWKDGFEDWVKLHKVLSILQSSVLNKTLEGESELSFFNNTEEGQKYVTSLSSKAEIYQEKYRKPYGVSWVSTAHRENNIHLTQNLIHLLKEQKQLEGLRVFPNRVDGQIIGTGEADFTKDNVSYQFVYNDKTFQLVDVPGIEGDESKYENLVRKAIAKAHLVFYVNGTDKKPEKITAKKIKSYLNDYAKVYPILNLRGHYGSYYADEDSNEPCESLEQAHGDVAKLYNETLSVLKENIGEDLIVGGQYMQGLMAVSALAYNQDKKETTIFYGRNHDLGKDQKKFLELFNHDVQKMTNFSRINLLQQFIVSKFDTFKDDIIESNKLKVMRRIDETIEKLQIELDRHKILQVKVKSELDSGLSAINNLIDEFERTIQREWESLVNVFFLLISSRADKLIENNDWSVVGNITGSAKEKQENINNGISQAIKNNKDEFESNLKKTVEKKYQDFKNELNIELLRINKNVDKVLKIIELDNNVSSSDLNISFDSSFDISKMMNNLMSIGSMALFGASILTIVPIPGVATAVGGVAGAVLGFLKMLWDDLKGKDARVASRKNKFKTNLDDEKAIFIRKLNREASNFRSNFQDKMKTTINPVINAEYEKMRDIERILSAEIQTISNLKQSIKEKDYGTV